MDVVAGLPFTATLVDPGGLTDLNLGARIEVPVTRAIVGMWTEATLAGIVWSATMDAPPAQPIGFQNPASRAIYEDELAAGEFQLVWMDDLDPPTVEIYVPLRTVADVYSGLVPLADNWPVPDLTQMTPTVDDVAVLERTRTVDTAGAELIVFNANTRPTDTEVSALIVQAVNDVQASLRSTYPTTYYGQIRYLTAMYAAMLVEGSFYREQLTEGSVQLYRQLINTELAGIQAAIMVDLTDQVATTGRLY